MPKENCKCGETARDGTRSVLFLHLPNCEHFDAELRSVLTALVRGIEAWAADEDGVHDQCWGAYAAAKVMIGEPTIAPSV